MTAIGGPLALAAARAISISETEGLSGIVHHHRTLAASQNQAKKQGCEEQSPENEMEGKAECEVGQKLRRMANQIAQSF